MTERRTKREDNTVELEQDECTYVLEPAKIEVGSGYALCINYDENDKPVIDLKTFGKVDLEKVSTEILRLYPNARIRRLNRTRTITVAKRKAGKKGER